MDYFIARSACQQVCCAMAILLPVQHMARAEDYRISTQEQFLEASARTYGPGDRVLLERGKRFAGRLLIRGRGEPGRPVIVDAFGEGALPILDGNGLSDYKGVLQIDDTGQIEVGNLEITNAFGTKTRSYGILVQDNSGEKHSHVYIRDCYVHHITSDDSNCSAESGDKNLGGIRLAAKNGTLWDDVLVENNRIEYAGRSGITTSSWNKPPPPGSKDKYNLDDTSDCITNLRIRKNRIAYASGDGIKMCGTYKGLCEYNVAHHCGYKGNAKPTEVSAGIWGGFKNIDCVFQYNEAYAHFPSSDSAGFDVDGWSKITVIQYNYSHDNSGGFILSWHKHPDCVVRHNVSVNEKPFGSFNNTKGIAFENNTFYLGDGMKGTYRVWGAEMRSNLLVSVKGGFSTNKSSVTSVGDYYYTPNGKNPAGTGKETADPGFVNPCGATSPIGLANLGGFRLKADSPCPNVGADVAHILKQTGNAEELPEKCRSHGIEKENSEVTNSEQDSSRKCEWRLAFADDGSGDWRDKWFLDGDTASVENTPQGMILRAGPDIKDNGDSMVLWTRDSFVGDVKVEYDFTRHDRAVEGVNIIYLKATGIGEPPYEKDIFAWKELRNRARMPLYFNFMNALHISYSVGLPDVEGEYIRARRYRTGHFGKWHLGTLTTTVRDSNRGGPEHAKEFSPPWLHGFGTCFSCEARVPTWDPMVTPDEKDAKGNPRYGEPGKFFGAHYWNEKGEIVRDNLDGFQEITGTWL